MSEQASDITPPAPTEYTNFEDVETEEPPTPVQNLLTARNRPMKHPLSPEQKCVSWLTKGVIEDVASSASSSYTSRHYWTDRQTEVVRKATQHLHNRAVIKEIYNAVQRDPECQRHKILETFSRQQIRDKFKNLVKKRGIF